MATHRTKPDSELTKMFAGMTQCSNPECGSIFDISLKQSDGLCQTCRDKKRGDGLDHRKRSTKDYGSETINSQYGPPKCPVCHRPILDCDCPPSVDDRDFEKWNAQFVGGKRKKKTVADSGLTPAV